MISDCSKTQISQNRSKLDNWILNKPLCCRHATKGKIAQENYPVALKSK